MPTGCLLLEPVWALPEEVEGSDVSSMYTAAWPGFSEELLQATNEFQMPSPIQAQCWPILQAGRDLVGIAATGSGKTLGFGLPLLKHVLAQRDAAGTQQKGDLTGL